MLLCLKIFEELLCEKIVYTNHSSSDEFLLERPEIYNQDNVLNTGVLYLSNACDLPDKVMVQEGAGLICIGTPSEYYFDAPVQILVIDEAVSLTTLSNDVIRIFFEYNTLEQKLQHSLNNSPSIQDMIGIIEPYLNGNEMTVMNADFRIVGMSGPISHTVEISGLPQLGINEIVAPEVVDFFKIDINYDKVKNLREPFIYEASIFKCRVLCMNVFYQDEFICRVTIAEDRNPFRSYESELLRFFTVFVQLVYNLTGDGTKAIPRDHMTEVFSDILKEKSVHSWRIENSLSQRKWQINGPFLCGFILPSDRDYNSRTMPYYCQVMNRDIIGCCAFEHNHGIVIVVDLSYYSNSMKCFKENNLSIFRDRYFRIGYSNTFTNMKDLNSYFHQAYIALETGLEKKPSFWYYNFTDIVMEYMELQLTEELDGRYICAPEIVTLHEYDKANNVDYLHTLTVYLNNRMNAVKTSKDLFIHRSTMLQRLERIKNLTSIDFEDFDKVLYLCISIRFLFNHYE